MLPAWRGWVSPLIATSSPEVEAAVAAPVAAVNVGGVRAAVVLDAGVSAVVELISHSKVRKE